MRLGDQSFEQDVAAIATVLAGDRCRVYNSANLPINSGAFTLLTFDSERWDTNGLHSTVANTSRITIVTPGYYVGFAGVSFASNAVGYRQAFVRLNGATPIAVMAVPAANGIQTRLPVSFQYPLDAGDYIEVMVLQNSGAPLNVEATAAYSPEFCVKGFYI